MTMSAVLRVLAIAIAVAAFIDPVISRQRPQSQPVAIVVSHVDDIQHGERLQRRLAAEYDAGVHVVMPGSAAAACPSIGACILVSRGEVPDPLTAGATVVGALRVRSEDPHGVIRRIDAPPRAHRDAAASLRVTLSRPVARLEVRDGELVVGSAEPGESLEVDVPWVPVGDGARALRVVADESSADVADVGVIVDSSPARVFVYEPEPTWMGTFVRRAIEDDARFAVVGRTRVAPPVAVTRGGVGPLSAAALSEASVVVVTSPHILSAGDVNLLDRFVTRRGGSLIVIPDQRPSGAMMRLIPGVADEQRDAESREMGLLRAREWVTFVASAGMSTLAAVDDEPVIIARAIGRGRVVVSGALDAWRFRDASSNFNTFWTGLTWEAATAAGEPLHVTVEPRLVSPGETVRVKTELQAIDDPPTGLGASAELTCDGGQRDVVRLWPAGRQGSFEGVMRPAAAGPCRLTLAVNHLTATTPLIVREDLRRLDSDDGALEAAMAAHAGLVVEIGEGEQDLISFVGTRVQTPRVTQPTRPMRSPFWLVLFAACLGCEWWLRRRSGLS